MTRERFQGEIKRLQTTFGEKAYPVERIKLFWRAFEREEDETFTQAIDIAIANRRAAPMHHEIDEALIEARRAATSKRFSPPFGGVMGIMEYAQKENKTCDKDFAKMCLTHLGNFINKDITKEQFLSGCADIDTLAKQLRR